MNTIVNAATEVYKPIQDRLRKSLKRYGGDVNFAPYEVTKEVHLDNPYAFKISCMEQHKGNVLWLDASCYAVRPIKAVFDIIQRDGYFMEQAGHYAGTWTNDFTLDYFGLTRDEAMKIEMFSAGFTGVNFNSPIGIEFFRRWKASMEAGCFKGNWSNSEQTESRDPRCEGHRHDMSCASIISYRLGMKYQRGGTYFQYGAPDDKPINKTVCFYLQGI